MRVYSSVRIVAPLDAKVLGLIVNGVHTHLYHYRIGDPQVAFKCQTHFKAKPMSSTMNGSMLLNHEILY